MSIAVKVGMAEQQPAVKATKKRRKSHVEAAKSSAPPPQIAVEPESDLLASPARENAQETIDDNK